MNGTSVLGQMPYVTRTPSQPRIVTLCGSTRFFALFQEAALRETLLGLIVISIGSAKASDQEHFAGAGETGERVKEMLDELHLRKIDRADEILVLDGDVGGNPYIGASTAREINYAASQGKRIRYWSDEKDFRTNNAGRDMTDMVMEGFPRR